MPHCCHRHIPMIIRDFRSPTDRYRGELWVHCYRILGSFEDAEDALQDALFSPWRQFDSLRSQSSLRAWLYKIATNGSLNMLASRRVSSIPTTSYEPPNPDDPLQAPIMDSIWLDPLSDEIIAGVIASPRPATRRRKACHWLS